ncbi:MAG: hypothetical protein AB1916_07115 [Thermodesulfobacteriota bacterium]
MKRGSRILRATLLLSCILVLATACRTAPVHNVVDAPVPSIADQTKSLTLEEISLAMLKACEKLGWKMQTQAPGLAQAQLDIRNHQAVVDITYTATSYNITYVGSKNLKEGDGEIKSNYNRWVRNLDQAIGKELSAALAAK